ncbi:MAG: hypothetical protein ACI82Z_000658 [Cellvibrionaceae bacterium]|jgi:hypothetical protein
MLLGVFVAENKVPDARSVLMLAELSSGIREGLQSAE